MTPGWVLAPLRRVGGMPGVVALAERAGQTGWVLDHEADIDADFLAFYGLDLDTYPITGPRYLALAHRLTAYQGVMATRVENERDGAPALAEPVQRQGAQPGGGTEVTLTAFRAQFPGLVSMATSSGREG